MNPLLHARITPDAHAAKYQSLVWPRWDKDEELFTLLIEFGTAFQTDTKNQLVLYANPSKDGTRAACNARLQALLAAHTAFQSINVTVYHCALTPAIVHQLRKSMRSTLVLPSSMLPDRVALQRVLGLPCLPDVSSVQNSIDAWHVSQYDIVRDGSSSGERKPDETPFLIPEETMPSADWWARHDPKPEVQPVPRLAVIVPYRNRAAHLAQFGPYMAQYLKHIPHQLFIIEQDDDKPFNRGKLLNVGVHLLQGCYDFFALHDVDHFPVDADYSFPDHPVHLAARSPANNFEVMYETCMGGVLLINGDDFQAINGFSNSFWGWGAEDDDIYLRMKATGRYPSRRDGLYDCLPHPSNAFQHDHYVDNVRQLEEMRRGEREYRNDGLSTLDFELTGASQSKWFTRFKVAL